MKPEDPQYFERAASWADDRLDSLRRSRARAQVIAAVAVAIALCEAVALVVLMPLKTVEPYVITVDRQTGAAEVARGVAAGPLTQNEALVRALLADYVLARETIDASDLAANYRRVGLWSSGTARTDYLKAMDRRDPASVLNGATVATQVVTTVKSIVLLDKTSALVRFGTDRRDGDGPWRHADWTAALTFGFSQAPLGAGDRLINPLGLQVSRYRRDAEGGGLATPVSP